MDPKKPTLLSFRNSYKKPISRNGFQLWQGFAASNNKGWSRKIQYWLFVNNKTLVKVNRIKIKKDKTHYFEMINRTGWKLSKIRVQLPLPKLPENLPKNIAPTERPNKKIVIETQKSRFFKEKLHQ